MGAAAGLSGAITKAFGMQPAGWLRKEDVSGKSNVMFENRSLSAINGQLTDEFKPLEAHVYELGR